MFFRTVTLRFLPVVLFLLTACSDSGTKTETNASAAPEETMATTADAIDSSKSASPIAASTAATPTSTPRPSRLTAPDTTYAQDVALFLGGQQPSQQLSQPHRLFVSASQQSRPHLNLYPHRSKVSSRFQLPRVTAQQLSLITS